MHKHGKQHGQQQQNTNFRLEYLIQISNSNPYEISCSNNSKFQAMHFCEEHLM